MTRRPAPLLTATLFLTATGRWLRSAGDAALWRIFPGCCRCCGLASGLRIDLCAVCAADLPRDRFTCATCARPLPRAVQRCGACLRPRPPFTRTVAALRYAAPVDALVADVKFHNRLASARILGTLLTAAVRAAYHDDLLPDLVVPVPLSLHRLLRRGHDQAALLARHVARDLGLPCAVAAVARVRHTAPQSRLRSRARQRNLVGAFAVRKTVTGRHVAVVDDVLTTGATVREVALALRRAGAARVDVWVAARTPEPAY